MKFVFTTVDFAMARRRLERGRIAAVYEASTSGQQLVADSFPVRPSALHRLLCGVNAPLGAKLPPTKDS